MSWFQLEYSWFFLRSVWYDAVVALREEHIYILSCCWAVLHRTNNIVGFHLLVPFWQWRGKEGTRSREGKESECWPELAKGIFHLMWHHAKKKKKKILVKWWRAGWWASAAWGLAEHQSMGGALCITLFCLYISLLLSFFLSLSHLVNTFCHNLWVLLWVFSDTLYHPTGLGGAGKWMNEQATRQVKTEYQETKRKT